MLFSNGSRTFCVLTCSDLVPTLSLCLHSICSEERKRLHLGKLKRQRSQLDAPDDLTNDNDGTTGLPKKQQSTVHPSKIRKPDYLSYLLTVSKQEMKNEIPKLGDQDDFNKILDLYRRIIPILGASTVLSTHDLNLKIGSPVSACKKWVQCKWCSVCVCVCVCLIYGAAYVCLPVGTKRFLDV